jgi:hypothetical protein
MHYRIVEPADPDAARVLGETLAWLNNDPEMKRDRERLVKVCCAPQLLISIQGAPDLPVCYRVLRLFRSREFSQGRT